MHYIRTYKFCWGTKQNLANNKPEYVIVWSINTAHKFAKQKILIRVAIWQTLFQPYIAINNHKLRPFSRHFMLAVEIKYRMYL